MIYWKINIPDKEAHANYSNSMMYLNKKEKEKRKDTEVYRD